MRFCDTSATYKIKNVKGKSADKRKLTLDGKEILYKKRKAGDKVKYVEK
jgi:hypothetical protein